MVSVEIYDIASDSWNPGINLPDAATALMQKAKLIGNHIFFVSSNGFVVVYRPEEADSQKWDYQSIQAYGGTIIVETTKLVKPNPA